MTAPKAARAKTYAKAQVREITFRPEHEELFSLAGDTWQRPRKVRVRVTSTSYTFEAKFIMDTGTVATLRTRARRYADGKVFVTERRLAMHFAFSAKGAAR